MQIYATGVYLVKPGLGALREALLRHGDKADVRSELGSLALVELEVRAANDPLDLSCIHQAGNDNVPYDERYFSLDRSRVLGGAFGSPNVSEFAVAFFLHCFQEGEALETPCGLVPLPAASWDRPMHLQQVQYKYYD